MCHIANQSVALMLYLFLFLSSIYAADYTSQGWTKRTPIGINTTYTPNAIGLGANVSANVTNFPILVRLNINNFNFSEAMANGEDIRFTKSNFVDLKYDIERWDPTAKLAEIWVRLDTVFGNNDRQNFFMYWGKTGVTTTANTQDVFDTTVGFAGAWSYKSGTATVNDATYRGNNGTKSNTADQDGLIGNSLFFNGTNSQVDFGDKLPMATDWTISTWVKVFDAAAYSSQYLVFMGRLDEGLVPVQVNYELYFDVLNNTYGLATTSPPGTWSIVVSSAARSQWFYIGGQYNQSTKTITLFVNGDSVQSIIIPQDPFSTGQKLAFGAASAAGGYINYFHGQLDQTEIAWKLRSRNWMKLAYGTQQSNSRAVIVGFRSPENPANTMAGVSYKYFLGTWSTIPNFDALAPRDSGITTNFLITAGNPAADNFGYAFNGYIDVPDSGIYTFFLNSDDDSRLFIGNTIVADNSSVTGNAPGSIGLRKGKHSIKVWFIEKTGGQSLQVSWQGPGISNQIIPAANLFQDLGKPKFTYTDTLPQPYFVGQKISDNIVKKLSPNTIDSFYVLSSTPLPTGLSLLSYSSGTITGIPAASRPVSNYRIVGVNRVGACTTTVRMSVVQNDIINPLTISGLLVDSTHIRVRLGGYSSIPTTPALAYAESIGVWFRAETAPTEPPTRQQPYKKILLSTMKAAGTNYDTVILVPKVTNPANPVYHLAASVFWLTIPKDTIAPFGSCRTTVNMTDTAHPKNALSLIPIGTADGYKYPDTAKIRVVNISTGLDNSTARLSYWYVFGQQPNLLDTANKVTITRAQFLSGIQRTAVDTFFRITLRDPRFEGLTQTVTLAMVQIGNNGLASRDTIKTSFNVGYSIPTNGVLLTASALSATQILLSWSQLDAADDSVRIWQSNIRPITINTNNISIDTFGIGGAAPKSLPRTVHFDTIEATPEVPCYFGLQTHNKKVWTTVTTASSISFTLPRSTNVDSLITNKIRLTSIRFDTITNKIRVGWRIDTTVASLAALRIGISYSIGGYTSDTIPLSSLIFSRPSLVQETTFAITPLIFDTTYYVSLFLGNTSGFWRVPTDTSRGTVHSPGFSTQQINYFGSDDPNTVITAFNGNVVLRKGPIFIGTKTNEIRNIPTGSLNTSGFIPASIAFSFRDTISEMQFFVGAKCNVPAGHSISDVRMYRILNSGPALEWNTVVDTSNGRVSAFTDLLGGTFIAMVDTTPPTISFLSDTAIVRPANTAILDSFTVSDNVANVKCKLEYARGDVAFIPPIGMPFLNREFTATSTTVTHTIDANSVSADHGLRARIIINDGVFPDTVNISRRIIRPAGIEKLSTTKLAWIPIKMTADLDEKQASSILTAFSLNNVFIYNTKRIRLFRWFPQASNAAKPDKWIEYSDGTKSLFNFQPGYLYWIKTAEATEISFGQATTLSLKEPYSIDLAANGWTDISNPFKFGVVLGDIFAQTGLADTSFEVWKWELDTTSNLKKYKLTIVYNSTLDEKDNVNQILAAGQFDSYTIFNRLNQNITLKIPPIPWTLSGYLNLPKIGTLLSEEGFTIEIKGLSRSQGQLNDVYCAYHKNFRGSTSPIRSSFSTIQASVVDQTTRNNCSVVSLNKQNAAGGFKYLACFSNQSDSTEQLKISTNTFGALPSGASVGILDPSSNTFENYPEFTVDLGPGQTVYRYVLIGAPEFLSSMRQQIIPYALMLNRVGPNPFKGNISIEYTLPFENVRSVQFAVYDLQGRSVWRKQLESSAVVPGPGRLYWNTSRTLSAGVYYFQMVAYDNKGRPLQVFKRSLCRL